MPSELESQLAMSMKANEVAWGIIANAYGGDWDHATLEWKSAAENWRDEHWYLIIAMSAGEAANA